MKKASKETCGHTPTYFATTKSEHTQSSIMYIRGQVHNYIDSRKLQSAVYNHGLLLCFIMFS